MNILVVGGGGREHALVWKLLQSPSAAKVYCAPGNGGICREASCVDIDAMDIKGLLDFAKKSDFSLFTTTFFIFLATSTRTWIISTNLFFFYNSL